MAILGHPFAACGEPLKNHLRESSLHRRVGNSLLVRRSIPRGPRAAGAALTAMLAVTSWAADAQPPPLSAEPARLAAQSLLIAIAPAGERLVAVGDRGIVVLSDDRGASWMQALEVPTEALLTGVCFLDAQHGVAVGHDEVILTSADAGRTWKRTHYAPEAQRPLLDVWCGTRGRVIAIGAYSTYLTSEDGGASWSEGVFTPAPLSSSVAPARPGAAGGAGSATAQEAAAGGYHLNRIVSGGGARLYIAAEAGHLYRSDDNGVSWQTLASPYQGSFFGVLPLTGPVSGESILAFGLRGNLFRSEDAGSSWRKIDSGTLAMLDGAARFDDGAVAIVGLSGVVLVSHDGGRTFTLSQQADRAGLAAAVTAGDAKLVAVGEHGAKVISLGGAPAGAGSTP
jgi:photosystem II stability/assembly factor-like uncharacterized protein